MEAICILCASFVRVNVLDYGIAGRRFCRKTQ